MKQRIWQWEASEGATIAVEEQNQKQRGRQGACSSGCLALLVGLEAPVGQHAVVAQGDAKDTWDGVHHVANQQVAPAEGPVGQRIPVTQQQSQLVGCIPSSSWLLWLLQSCRRALRQSRFAGCAAHTTFPPCCCRCVVESTSSYENYSAAAFPAQGGADRSKLMAGLVPLCVCLSSVLTLVRSKQQWSAWPRSQSAS